VSKLLKDQLREWVNSAPKPPSPPQVTAVAGFPRDNRSSPDRLRASLPTTILEAEVRRNEAIDSLARIDQQLAESAGDEDWERRARTARRGYEYELSRLDTCVRVFQREQTSDKATFAVLQKELDDAKEACRRLAGEVERLSSVASAVPKDANIRVAIEFVEVCRIGMAESAFTRYMNRARDRVHGKTR
jgi:hypothetical protein